MQKVLLSINLIVCIFVLSVLLSCKKTCNHDDISSLILEEGIDSSCLNDGYSDIYRCPICEQIIIDSEVISKKNHQKAVLIKVETTAVNGIKNAGLFQCSECLDTFYDSIGYADLGMPILNLDGDFSGISKENKVKISANYTEENQSFDCSATLKWQGNSSVSYPKKNYNIQLFEANSNYTKKFKVKMKDGWSEECKYTLKANWVDYSQARNIVSAKLYGEIVKSRENSSILSTLINGGAIDGYPIVLYKNGVFEGLYSLNIPKEKWMVGMDGDTSSKEAMLMSNGWSNSNRLKELIPNNPGNNWYIDYASGVDGGGDNSPWIYESFNNMIEFINANDGTDFIDNIDRYVDIEASVDFLLLTTINRGLDNLVKNTLWVTYDGVKWIPVVYDMDATWGFTADGSKVEPSNSWNPFNSTVLWRRIGDNYYDYFLSRWAKLRGDVLSLSNIDKIFVDYLELIPGLVREAEQEKWPDVICQEECNLLSYTFDILTNLKKSDSDYGYVSNEEIPYKITSSFSSDFKVGYYTSINSDSQIMYGNVAYSRDLDTGYLLKNGGGIVFEVKNFNNKVYYCDIEGTYENLVKISENKYYISGIESDLIINIFTE